MVAIVVGSGLGLTGASSSVLGSAGQLGGAGLGQGNEAVTVNARTGNLIVQHQDELLIGRGPDVSVIRTYNSNATFDFDNNDDWQLSLYKKLSNLTGTVNTLGSTLRLTGGDGAQLTYTYDASLGQYINKDGGGAYDSLSYASTSNTWTATDGDSRRSETYGASPTAGEWRVTGQSDLDGNSLSYAYDANGLISQVSDANGETTTLTYDAATKRLSSIQVVTGTVTTTRVRYAYDDGGRLAIVTTDLTPADGSIADGKTYSTTYTYDGTSLRIASITNSDGTQVSFTYDTSFRVKTVVDGAGKVTTFTYNTGNTTVTDPLGQSSTLTYDTAGNLTRLQGATGSGQDVSYVYNGNGDLTQLTDSRGNTVTYAYDSNGNLLRQQDAAGNVVERAYNSANQLVKETAYAVADPDGAGSSQASTPQVTYYVRDANQHVRFTVSPEGRVTEYRYNAQGQQVTGIVYPAGTFVVGSTSPIEADLVTWVASQAMYGLQRIDTAYDARGLVSSITRFTDTHDKTGAGLVDGSQAVTRYVYDSAGRLLQQIDPRGVATTGVANDYLTAYVYDGIGRTIRVTQYDAAGSSVGSGTTRQTLTTFTDASRRIEVSLANGLKRLSTFDQRGLLLSQVEQDGTTTLSTQSYQYDADGQLRVTTDPNGNKTYTLYDIGGRKVGEIDASGGLSEFVYDNAGLVIKTIRYADAVSANLATLFAPDGTGAIPNVAIASIRPAASTNNPTSRAIYDGAGRLRFSIDARGYVTENRYDGTGRLLSTLAYANALNNVAGLDSLGREATPADILLLAATPSTGQIGLLLDSANDRVTRNLYDNDGLLRGTLDGEGYLTEFKYDAAGRLNQTIRYSTATNATDRAAGTLATLITSANATPGTNIVSYAYYNGLGQQVGSLDGEGYYTAYQYDVAGNLTRSTRYANRAVGTVLAGTPPPVYATPPLRASSCYVLSSTQDQASQGTWTAFGQIDTETAVDGTLSKYTYDSVGNRLTTIIAQGAADSRTRQARYDKQGRLTQELSALGSQALAALGATPNQAQIDAVWSAYGSTYTYDASGRRTQSTDANGNVTLFFYDAANRLTFSVRRVRNPANAAEWVGEVNARQFNALGQLTAEIRYANRIAATDFATLSGGSEAQIKVIGIIIADAANDSRSDYTYLLTGQLSRSTVKLNATENAVTESFVNAFGERSALQIALDANWIRREEFVYDRRGLQLTDKQDVAWISNIFGTRGILATTYDAFGRAIRYTQNYRSNVSVDSTASYDKLGRQIQTVKASGSLNSTHKVTYDAFGRVLTQTDALGNVTTYGYAIDTVSGQTTLTITTPEGTVTKTVTDRYGQTLTLVDGLGNETRNSYDANGRLTSSKRWDKAANVETTLETDSYDAVGNLLSTTDANGNTVAYSYDAANRTLTRRIDPTGLNLTTTYRYDAKGQQVSVTDPNGVVTQNTYDLAGRLVQVAIDPTGLNLRTQYTYDLVGNQITVVEGYGSTTARTTEYSYDSLGRRTRIAVDPAGLNLVTTYAYDPSNLLVTRVDAADTTQALTTRYIYDQFGRLIWTIDALGGLVKNDYDKEDRLLQSTVYANAIDLTGLTYLGIFMVRATLVTVDATRDRTTRHVYDNNGRERFTIDALGAVSENQYDANGNVVKRIQYANALQGTLTLGSAPPVVATVPGSGPYVLSGTADRITTYAYDAFNRLTSKTSAAGTSIAQTENFAYDTVGNLVRHTDARGNQEWFAYDKANRQTRHIDQGGYVTDTAWNADGTRQSEKRYVNAVALSTTDNLWAYAGHAANPVANTDAVSGDRTTSYTYDKAGRTVTRTDTQGVVTRYAYDSLNNLLDTTEAYGTALAATLHREYDLAGRVIAETRAYGKPEASRTSYAYDAQGNQTQIIEAAGTTAARSTTQEFDVLGRKTAAVDGTGARTSTAYNRFGEIVKVTDALGNVGYFYNDALGRVTLQVDPEGAVSETRYDLLGNTTDSVKYANPLVGSVSETTRPQVLATAGSGAYVVKNDTADQHQQVIYDVLGRKSETRTWWGPNAADYYSETFTYDSNNNVLTAKARNGATTTYEYNKLDQKTRELLPVTSKNASNVDTAVENRFAYDALGNLTTKTEAYGLPEQRITAYTYDKLNRQVKETGQAIITFDPVSQTDVVVTPIKQAIYNAAGNLVEEVDAKGGRTLHYYDAQHRETGRIDAAGAFTQWTYDAAGNKTSQTAYANAVQVVGGGTIPNGTAPGIVTVAPTVAGTPYVLSDAGNDRTVNMSYDAAGRLAGTRIDGMTLGANNPTVGSGTYQVRTGSTGSIATGTTYDALGNVVKTIDGNGNVTRSYYNKAGQKLGQLDAKGYLTLWARDAYGNVAQETKYANAVSGTLTVSDTTTLATLVANVTASSDDRISVCTYDKLNRALTETRQSVASGSVNATTGVLSEATADAVTSYVYDGLNNVTRKTDTVGAVTDWTYDGLGRKTKEQRPGYTDYLGSSVRPTTDTEYDGLNHVKREIVRGTDNAVETDDRITTYTYGTGGFLSTQTDALGVVTQYRIDANGNVTKKTLIGRGNADGTTPVNDATLYQYDALNHQVKSTDVATGTTQEMRYDAFGEVTGKRTNGGGAQASWQEFAQYDQAGRTWISNSGDGVTKVYVFDANGNATLSIQSSGSDLTGQSLAQVLARSDTLKTISVFDARNQLTDSFQPTMDAVHQLAAVLANSTGQAVFVGNGSAISIGADPSITNTSPGVVNPVTSGTVDFNPGVYLSGMTSRNAVRREPDPPPLGRRVESITTYLFLDQLNGFGDGIFKIRIGATNTPLTPVDGQVWSEYLVSGNTSAYQFYKEFYAPMGNDQGYLSIQIYKQTGQGDVLLLNAPNVLHHWSCGKQSNRGYGYSQGIGTTSRSLMEFKGQPNTATSLLMAYRLQGSSGPYSWWLVPQTMISGAPVAGGFTLDRGPFSGNNWDIQYFAFDAAGGMVNSQQINLNLSNPAAPTVTQNNGALGGIGGAGRGILSTDGNLYLTQLGNTASSAFIKYRVKGSGSAWNTITPTKHGAYAGWFSVPYASYFAAGTTYEFDISTYNGAGALINRSLAEFSRDAGGNPGISAFTAYSVQPAMVHLTERTDTQYIDISYRINGSTGAYTTVRVNPTSAGVFDWDASALVAVATSNYDYDVVIKAYSTGGLLNNQTAATLRLGANAAVLSASPQNTPLVLRLTPPQSDAASIKLGYRLQGSTGDYTTLATTLVAGEFRADLSGLSLPASGSLVYEYIYDAYNAGGALLGRDAGNFTLQSAGASSSRLDWVIQNVSNVSTRIHKSQLTNAFGEVVQEIDGLGRVTNLSFNTLGQLVKKEDPETNVTLANGFVQRARPTTRYVYDLAGRLVASIDPNGNTTTQAWLNGSADSQIVRERHADGGVVTHGYDIFGDKRFDVDAIGGRTDNTYDKLSHVIQVAHQTRADSTRAIDSYTYDAAGHRITHTDALGDVEKTFYDSLGRVTQYRSYNGFNTTYSYVYSNAILGVGGLQTGGWQTTTTDAVGRTLIDRQDGFGHTTWHQDLGGHQFTYTYNGAGWAIGQTGTSGQNIATDYYANGYVKSIWDKATGAYTSYEYDAAGNRIFEGYIYLKNPADLNGGVRDYYQYANLEYDELNRLKRVLDPKAEIKYEYDAAGNRRHMLSTYHDGINGAMQTQDYWYKYDAMNRFTTTMGKLSNGTRGSSASDTTVSIVQGSTGVDVGYNLAGQRIAAANGSDGSLEQYSYSADGYLEDVKINSVLRSRRTNDLLGRVSGYTEWSGAAAQTYTRSTIYDKDSRVLTQTGTDGSTTNTYYTDATDNAASATGAGEMATSVVVNGSTISSYFKYEYWDDAKETAVTAQAWDAALQGNNAYWRPGYASHSYDVNGHLKEAVDAGADGVLGNGDDRKFRYVTDAQGLIMARNELAGGSVNRVQRYYYANGVRVGDVGNDGPSRTDYAQAIAARGVDHKNYKNWTPVASADFDQNYEPVSPSYPGMTPGSYTVRTGDTLQGIARSIWGDASLWYLIADSNGLTGSETLTSGQVLTLPNKLTNIHNNAGTFRAYSAGEAIGDTSPTIPTPPPAPSPSGKHGGCGGLAQIVIAIIVVVVTIYTAGAAASAMGAVATGTTAAGATASTMALGTAALTGGTLVGVGGAAVGAAVGLGAALIGGAVGSIVGQGLSMAAGLQDKFSWGAVAAGALGAAAGSAMGPYLNAAPSLVSAVASNVATQGINILTGRQKNFSWSSLAASAIAAPIAEKMNGGLVGKEGVFAKSDDFTKLLVKSTTSALVSATTRVAIQGGKLSWSAVAADALSSTFRGMYGSGGSGSGSQQPNAQLAVEENRADLGVTGSGTQSDTAYDAEMARLHQMADSELGGSRAQPTGTSNVGLASNNDRSFISNPYVENINGTGGEHWSSGADTNPVADNRLAWRPLPDLPNSTPLFAEGRSSMNSYWSQYADEGVNQGSFTKYLFGQVMQKAGNFGYDVAEMSVAAYNNPEQAAIGGAKSLVRFGPDAFNFTANSLKTSLNGYSLVLENIGGRDGAFSSFRETNAYNIAQLVGYDNKAQAGGALFTQTALGVGLAKYGDYGIELNTGAPGTLYSNPIPIKLVAPEVADFGVDAAGATRRIATIGDKQLPTAGGALSEALARHDIDPSTVETTTMYGKNPNLVGPQGQPWEMVRGLNSNGELIEFDHHANGHFFSDTNEFELPHYHGPKGEHLTY